MADQEIITTTNEAFQVHLANQKFSSFKAFETKFKEFQNDTGSVFRIKSSSSVAVENKRRKTHIPDCFKYGSISYCCVHYGKPKVQGHGVRPKQRYLPCGCGAMIALSYSRGFLVVTKSNMEHNHSLDPETAVFYPSNRRLEVGQIQDVQDILTLNPGAKQLKDFVSTKYNKVVTLKDIHNIRSKFKSKSDNMNALCDLLEEIGDEGRVSVHMSEEQEFQMVCFASMKMIRMYHQYPEVLFMDGTYKVNKYGFPLYQVMVQDNLGRGRAVFYAFVSDESAQSLDRMVKEFKKAMGDDTAKSLTVMLDKDHNEIAAVHNNLPHTRILLCTFHVLKNFKKKVSELLLPTNQKEEIFRAMRQIVYARSQDHMNELVQNLTLNNEMHHYIQLNWLPEMHMWALHLRDSVVTFGNNTNNRVESENAKVKHLLSSSSSLTECVKSLMFHNQILDAERDYNHFLQQATSVHYINTEADMQRLFDEMTDFAITKIRGNYNPNSSMVVGDVTSAGAYPVTDNGKTYSVCLQARKCSCTFSSQFKLPCRHQIYLARHLGQELAELAMGSRWSKDNSRLESLPVASGTCVSETQSSVVMTANERYNKATELTKRLALVLTTCGTSQFNQRLGLLKDILACWEAGTELSIQDLQLSDESPISDPTEDDLDMEIPVENLEIPVLSDVPAAGRAMEEQLPHVPESAEIFSMDEDISHSTEHVMQSVPSASVPQDASASLNVVSDLSVLRVMQLPAIKRRGRPREVRRMSRFNSKRGVKRKGDKAGGTNNQRGNVENDLRKVCYCEDPPREVNRDSLVQWIGCETCEKWFHSCCISVDPETTYVCSDCDK